MPRGRLSLREPRKSPLKTAAAAGVLCLCSSQISKLPGSKHTPLLGFRLDLDLGTIGSHEEGPASSCLVDLSSHADALALISGNDFLGSRGGRPKGHKIEH